VKKKSNGQRHYTEARHIFTGATNRKKNAGVVEKKNKTTGSMGKRGEMGSKKNDRDRGNMNEWGGGPKLSTKRVGRGRAKKKMVEKGRRGDTCGKQKWQKQRRGGKKMDWASASRNTYWENLGNKRPKTRGRGTQKYLRREKAPQKICLQMKRKKKVKVDVHLG